MLESAMLIIVTLPVFVSLFSPFQKPTCQYGEKCYQKNPKHLARFRHPSVRFEIYTHICVEEEIRFLTSMNLCWTLVQLHFVPMTPLVDLCVAPSCTLCRIPPQHYSGLWKSLWPHSLLESRQPCTRPWTAPARKWWDTLWRILW